MTVLLMTGCGGSAAPGATGGTTGTGGAGGQGSASGVGGRGGAAGTGSGVGGMSGAGGSTATGTGGAAGSGAGAGSTGSGTGGSGAGGGAGSGASAGAGGVGGAGGTVPVGGGPGGVYSCTPGVQQLVITDCGYPTTSGSPLASTAFNENEVLRAIQPAGSWPNGVVQLFYNDEHAMTLGVRQVAVKTTSGTTTTDYPITALATDPGSSTNPQIGTNVLGGDQSGLDASLRPMWPSLFLTDISVDPNNRSGDWQQGGAPIAPGAIFGSWKAAVRSIDKTKTPNLVTVTPDADPAKNNWSLPGGDPVPAGLANEGYGAEARWNVSLTPGHSYRIQVLVHDGDQNKAGGDSGEACVLFCAGADGCSGEGCGSTGTGGSGGTPICPFEAAACGPGGIDPASCPTGTVCADGCCLSIGQ